jgi:hypothetical protein
MFGAASCAAQEVLQAVPRGFSVAFRFLNEIELSIRLAAVIPTAGLIGCSPVVMPGTVAVKGSNNEAQVSLGNLSVKAGDRVVLFNFLCGGRFSSQAPDCKRERLGEGIVTRTLDEHISIVKVDSGVEFKEGAHVEKL